MKRFILVGLLITFLLFPIVGSYGWVVSPYGVAQVVDLDNGLNWLIVANFTSYWYAEADLFGNIVYFEFGRLAIATNGSIGWGLVQVNLIQNKMWVTIWTDAFVIAYYTQLQYIVQSGGVYVLGGYYAYGIGYPSAVLFAFVVNPSNGTFLVD